MKKMIYITINPFTQRLKFECEDQRVDVRYDSIEDYWGSIELYGYKFDFCLNYSNLNLKQWNDMQDLIKIYPNKDNLISLTNEYKKKWVKIIY